MARRKAASSGRTRAGSTAKGRRRAPSIGRKAKKKAGARKSAARKTAGRKSSTRAAAKKRRSSSARRPASRKAAAPRKTAARKKPSRSSGRRAGVAAGAVAAKKAAKARKTTGRRPQRRGFPPTPPSSLDFDRRASAVRTGRQELRERFDEHTAAGPTIAGGDIDADWESAYSVGDEAPGGDNPTPDQDIVDDIGRAVGVEYQDNEELKSEEKIAKRDRHRWELDPASSEDYDDR